MTACQPNLTLQKAFSKKIVAFFFGTLAKIIKYMNSQHNTIIKQKLLKCLRCYDKDCNKSISKTSKAISLEKKHANIMCI